MNKSFFVVAVIAILMLTFTCSQSALVAAQADFIAPHGNAIPDSQIDGVIGSEWNDANYTPRRDINPWGLASFWVKNDGTNLYIAMRFYADSDNPWVGFQFGSSFCMSTSADGAMFRRDNNSQYTYQDVYFTEQPNAAPDAIQDGKGALTINSSRAVILELKKPLNSGDSAGKDINWTLGGTYAFLAVWDSGGSGTANHNQTTSPISKTINISSEAIPEFPTPLFLCAFGVLLPAAIIMRRWIHRGKTAFKTGKPHKN
jgi:hypothetical protein